MGAKKMLYLFVERTLTVWGILNGFYNGYIATTLHLSCERIIYPVFRSILALIGQEVSEKPFEIAERSWSMGIITPCVRDGSCELKCTTKGYFLLFRNTTINSVIICVAPKIESLVQYRNLNIMVYERLIKQVSSHSN